MDRLPLARDIMVTKLVTVSPADAVLDGARLLQSHGITGAPVVGEDRTFLGMLSERSCIRLLTGAASEARAAGVVPEEMPARTFMATKVTTLRPETDAIEAIELLLRNRFSGAPVVDGAGRFLGVFSERYVMGLLVHSAYESAPTSTVGAFMNTDPGRLVDEERDLLPVAQLFLDQYYRRLPVLRDGKVVGQISHRDVLRAEHQLLSDLARTPVATPGAGTADGAGRGAGLGRVRVADCMEAAVDTIEEETDFFAIAQLFLQTNRRRLPVLREGKLVGQISRRDLLQNALELVGPERQRGATALYLSAVMDPQERPLLNRAADYARGGPRQPASERSPQR